MASRYMIEAPRRPTPQHPRAWRVSRREKHEASVGERTSQEKIRVIVLSPSARRLRETGVFSSPTFSIGISATLRYTTESHRRAPRVPFF